MITTVASYKGGVGKSTTAAHLAAYLDSLAPTLLLDRDETKSVSRWGGHGQGFPFRVAPFEAAAKLSRDFVHIVIDTGQKPKEEELKAYAEGCDLLVIPTWARWLEADGLAQTIRVLQDAGATNYKVLLTHVAPDDEAAAAQMRELLRSAGAPVFATEIPRLKAFSKAALLGEIVSAHVDRQGQRAWDAYAAVGKELGI